MTKFKLLCECSPRKTVAIFKKESKIGDWFSRDKIRLTRHADFQKDGDLMICKSGNLVLYYLSEKMVIRKITNE